MIDLGIATLIAGLIFSGLLVAGTLAWIHRSQEDTPLDHSLPPAVCADCGLIVRPGHGRPSHTYCPECLHKRMTQERLPVCADLSTKD